jgi:voltage-gated potassium channel
MSITSSAFNQLNGDPTAWVDRRAELGERFRRATELPMVILSVIFLGAVVLPDVIDLPANIGRLEDGIEWAICAVFALELAANTYFARDRKRYLMTHWLEVVIVAVPFLRPVRVLRVLVVGARFWTQARELLREETFALLGAASISAVAVAAVLETIVERASGGPIASFTDALWWAAATITTVGYGDMYPVTSAGRAIGLGLMLVGVSLFGLLTARVSAFFLSTDAADDHKLDEILERLERIERQQQDVQLARLP